MFEIGKILFQIFYIYLFHIFSCSIVISNIREKFDTATTLLAEVRVDRDDFITATGYLYIRIESVYVL